MGVVIMREMVMLIVLLFFVTTMCRCVGDVGAVMWEL